MLAMGTFTTHICPSLFGPTVTPLSKHPRICSEKAKARHGKTDGPQFFSLLALSVSAKSVSLHPRFHDTTSALLGHCRRRYQLAFLLIPMWRSPSACVLQCL